MKMALKTGAFFLVLLPIIFSAVADARLSPTHRKLPSVPGKATSRRTSIIAVEDTIPFPDPTNFPSPCLNLPADRIHDGSSQAGWELVPFCGGSCVHDYDQSVELPLQFPFKVSGQTVNTVTVYIDGSLCLGGTGGLLGCIHAYNSMIDTSTVYPLNVNHIWFSSGPRGFSVIWDHVEGMAPVSPGLFNTFQVLISDGTAESMGDYNVCTCYDTMQWAERPGRVAFVDYTAPHRDFRVGGFGRTGNSFDGINLLHANDGVGFLEGQAICYDLEPLVRPPVALGFPEFPQGSSTFQLKTCGVPNELNLAFYFIPGREKTVVTQVTVNGDIPQGMLVDVSPHGDSYFVFVSWENIQAVDPFELEFVAQDNNSPSLSTTKSIYVQVENDCPGANGGGDEIEPTTISPTTVEPELIVEATEASTTAFPTTEEPTEFPTEEDTPAATTIEPAVCDDERGTTFDVAGYQKTCAWLRARLEDFVAASTDIPTVPAEWNGLLWGEVLCGNEGNRGVAYRICSESCGRCEDDCVDERVFYEVNGGAERTCQWLWTHENHINIYCNDAVSDANTRCPETCGTCDELEDL